MAQNLRRAQQPTQPTQPAQPQGATYASPSPSASAAAPTAQTKKPTTPPKPGNQWVWDPDANNGAGAWVEIADTTVETTTGEGKVAESITSDQMSDTFVYVGNSGDKICWRATASSPSESPDSSVAGFYKGDIIPTEGNTGAKPLLGAHRRERVTAVFWACLGNDIRGAEGRYLWVLLAHTRDSQHGSSLYISQSIINALSAHHSLALSDVAKRLARRGSRASTILHRGAQIKTLQPRSTELSPEQPGKLSSEDEDPGGGLPPEAKSRLVIYGHEKVNLYELPPNGDKVAWTTDYLSPPVLPVGAIGTFRPGDEVVLEGGDLGRVVKAKWSYVGTGRPPHEYGYLWVPTLTVMDSKSRYTFGYMSADVYRELIKIGSIKIGSKFDDAVRTTASLRHAPRDSQSAYGFGARGVHIDQPIKLSSEDEQPGNGGLPLGVKPRAVEDGIVDVYYYELLPSHNKLAWVSDGLYTPQETPGDVDTFRPGDWLVLPSQKLASVTLSDWSYIGKGKPPHPDMYLWIPAIFLRDPAGQYLGEYVGSDVYDKLTELGCKLPKAFKPADSLRYAPGAGHKGYGFGARGVHIDQPVKLSSMKDKWNEWEDLDAGARSAVDEAMQDVFAIHKRVNTALRNEQIDDTDAKRIATNSVNSVREELAHTLATQYSEDDARRAAQYFDAMSDNLNDEAEFSERPWAPGTEPAESSAGTVRDTEKEEQPPEDQTAEGAEKEEQPPQAETVGDAQEASTKRPAFVSDSDEAWIFGDMDDIINKTLDDTDIRPIKAAVFDRDTLQEMLESDRREWLTDPRVRTLHVRAVRRIGEHHPGEVDSTFGHWFDNAFMSRLEDEFAKRLGLQAEPEEEAGQERDEKPEGTAEGEGPQQGAAEEPDITLGEHRDLSQSESMMERLDLREPKTIAEIADKMGWTLQAAARNINGLVNEGLVWNLPHGYFIAARTPVPESGAEAETPPSSRAEAPSGGTPAERAQAYLRAQRHRTRTPTGPPGTLTQPDATTTVELKRKIQPMVDIVAATPDGSPERKQRVDYVRGTLGDQIPANEKDQWDAYIDQLATAKRRTTRMALMTQGGGKAENEAYQRKLLKAFKKDPNNIKDPVLRSVLQEMPAAHEQEIVEALGAAGRKTKGLGYLRETTYTPKNESPLQENRGAALLSDDFIRKALQPDNAFSLNLDGYANEIKSQYGLNDAQAKLVTDRIRNDAPPHLAQQWSKWVAQDPEGAKNIADAIKSGFLDRQLVQSILEACPINARNAIMESLQGAPGPGPLPPAPTPG